jgi:putative endonuclease
VFESRTDHINPNQLVGILCFNALLILILMKHFVYILYSENIDKFYVGETEDLINRIEIHNAGTFIGAYTKRASDWKLMISIECTNRTQARKIEKHIKAMKSRKYYESLATYPELKNKLLLKFQ